MLVLLRECGTTKTAWFWSTEQGDYVKRVRGEIVRRMTGDELLDDAMNYPDSHRCDGLQKWIEAGRPR
jgi:hypothetical protein